MQSVPYAGKLYCLAGLLGLMALSVGAQSNLYVAMTGEDNNDAGRGQSWALPYRTITNGVAHAVTAGDTVMVSNGVYTNHATQIYINRNITLQSANGAEVTIIDGNYPAITSRCVRLNSSGALIDGFTIRNGYQVGDSGGGGVKIYASGAVKNCTIITNCTNDGHGGGIYISGPGTVDCCVISRNNVLYPNQGGGGIYVEEACSSNALINRCIISENRATRHSGGICFQNNQSIARNCLIFSNYVSGGYAGGVDLANGGILQNCTIVSNACSGAGGGIYAFSGTAGTGMVINTIIYSNLADSASRYNYRLDGGTAMAVFSNSCFYPALSGNATNISGNNTTNNPQFIDWLAGNYRFMKSSPCFNTGTNQDWMPGAVDLDGKIRSRYGAVDMGCYEYINPGMIFSAH